MTEKEMLNAILNRLDTFFADVNNLREDVSNIKEDVKNINEKVQEIPIIKQAVLETSKKVDKQERILEKLSLRSIEHETDIQELKRAK